MFPHVGFYDYIIGGERTELDIIEDYMGAGLQTPLPPKKNKRKVPKKSGIAIRKLLKSAEGARRTSQMKLLEHRGLLRCVLMKNR